MGFGRPYSMQKSTYARISLELDKNEERVEGESKMLTDEGKEGFGECIFMLDTTLTKLLVVTRIGD